MHESYGQLGTEFVSFPVRKILMHGDGVLLLCVYLRLSLVCDGVPVSCDRKVTLSPASRSVNDLMVYLGVSVLSPPREFPMCDQGCWWSCSCLCLSLVSDGVSVSPFLNSRLITPFWECY